MPWPRSRAQFLWALTDGCLFWDIPTTQGLRRAFFLPVWLRDFCCPLGTSLTLPVLLAARWCVSTACSVHRNIMGHEKQNKKENKAAPLLSTIFSRSMFRTHIMRFLSPDFLCHQTPEGRTAVRTYAKQWFSPIGYGSSVSTDCIKGRHWET